MWEQPGLGCEALPKPLLWKQRKEVSGCGEETALNTVSCNAGSYAELIVLKLDLQKCLIRCLLCAIDVNKRPQTTHTFWSCPSLNRFRSEIFLMLSKVTGKDIAPNALTALFGVPPLPVVLSCQEGPSGVYICLGQEVNIVEMKIYCPTLLHKLD